MDSRRRFLRRLPEPDRCSGWRIIAGISATLSTSIGDRIRRWRSRGSQLSRPRRLACGGSIFLRGGKTRRGLAGLLLGGAGIVVGSVRRCVLAAGSAGAATWSFMCGAFIRPVRPSSYPRCGRTPSTTCATRWPFFLLSALGTAALVEQLASSGSSNSPPLQLSPSHSLRF